MNDIDMKIDKLSKASELTSQASETARSLARSAGGALDKLFDDDWNAIEGGFDNYYFGYDGGGFASYDR